jgi:hypothetical protein
MRCTHAVAAAIAVACASPTLAGTLDHHGGGEVIEASYQLDITVDGLFATVEARQRVLAVGSGPTLAVYRFELPGDAAITGFAIAHGAATAEPGVITTAEGALPMGDGDTADAPEIGADRGMLARVLAGVPRTGDDPGSPATYVYTAAIEGKPVTITTRWTMPVRLEQGRVVIELPARRSAHLADLTGTVRFAPVAGLGAARDVRVGGVLVAKAPAGRATAWKLAAGAPLVIEAEVAVKGTRPVVLADHVDLGKDVDGNPRGAIAVSIVTPAGAAGRGPAAERLLVLADASRSMDRIDAAAIADAVATVLAAAPPSTQIEAIAFARTATRVLGDWRRNDAAARAAIVQGLAATARANGSDLRAALAAAAAALDPAHPTRIVVVTDAGFDLAASADALVAALGDRAGAVDVAALVAVAPDRTAPAHGVALLADLAGRLGGRVRVARADVIATTARRLLAESADGAPWTAPALAGNHDVVLPPMIAAGDGAAAIGWTTGAIGKLAITFERGGKPVVVAATAGGVDAGALGLARPGAAEALGGKWAAAVRAHPVVAGTARGIVVDGTTALGRDRRALIARGAPWARLLPAAERDDVYPLVADEVNALRAGAPAAATPPPGSTIDRTTLSNLFELGLVARLRGCYQRALGRAQRLEAHATFDLLIGDGEVIAAAVTGVADATFRDCLVEAAHQLQIPVVADATLIRVRYPVDFTIKAEKEYVVLGDADSAEPLDPSLLPSSPRAPMDLDRVDLDDPLGGMPPP